jgi:CBS domain-containing protein
VRISQILQTKRADLVVISRNSSIHVAISLMKRERVGALVVVDAARRLIGVLSERDVIHSLASDGAQVLQHEVGELMRTAGPVLKLQDTVQSAMRVMTLNGARHVPVVDGEGMIGVVSMGDIVKSRLDEITQENGTLRDLARSRVLAG